MNGQKNQTCAYAQCDGDREWRLREREGEREKEREREEEKAMANVDADAVHVQLAEEVLRRRAQKLLLHLYLKQQAADGDEL